MTPRSVLRHRRLAAAAAIAALAAGLSLHGAPSPAVAATTFTTPVELPQSAGLGEPSMALDSAGRLFATAPQSLGNITGGGSPVWTSTTQGSTWGQPVAPQGDPVSGGDTDVTVDGAGDVFQTDLWLGNSAMALSTDLGQSFVANEFGHVQPGDDRPWLAYSGKDNVLYLAYDGADAIHVAHTLPLSPPQAGLTMPFDIPAVPESIIACSGGCGTLLDTLNTRECVCPPGGIAVDQSTGSVYLSYSKQNGGGNGGGVGIARSDDGGFTWSYFSVPGTGSSGSAFDTEWNFDPIKVDSQGNVYVAWGESQKVTTDSNGNEVATGGVLVKYSWSSDHGQTWHAPVTLSTTTGENVFPTMDVVSPGVIDVAWYGAGGSGDPNQLPASTQWDVMFTQVTGAASAPAFTPQVAVSGIHQGCIQSGGLASCPDRGLLDFFQLVVDHAGMADIVYTAGQQGSGTVPATNLFFVRQAGSTATASPSASATPGTGLHGRGSGKGKGPKPHSATFRAFLSF